jgi:hypothetical protein
LGQANNPSSILKHDRDLLDAAYYLTQNYPSKTELGKCLGNYIKQTINLKQGMETTTQTNPIVRGHVIIEDRNTIIERALIAST